MLTGRVNGEKIIDMNDQSRSEERFFKAMYVIANQVPNFELDESTIEMYDKMLSSYGYDNLTKALEDIFKERKSTDPFPSVRAIIEKLEPTVEPKALAAEAASRIIGAVRKFGYSNPNEAKQYIGELGWAVVERQGSWYSLCTTMRPEQEPTLRAQFERLALGLQQRIKAGQNIDEGPKLNYSSNSKIASLATEVAEQKALNPAEEE